MKSASQPISGTVGPIPQQFRFTKDIQLVNLERDLKPIALLWVDAQNVTEILQWGTTVSSVREEMA